MYRKNYFIFLSLTVLFLSDAFSAFAKTGPVSGRVELKKADGTIQKVAGAVIEVYRTDVKGKSPSNKTDKNGNFTFAGLILGQTFAFSISAPGIKPEIYPNVRGGMENIVITVFEGDGKKYTEDEVRQSLTAPAAAPATTSSDGTQKAETPQKPQTTAEQKKAKEDYEKEVAAVNAKNEKNKNANALIQRVLDEGNKAYEANNYDLAVSKYDEGYKASPDFLGSAPTLLNNKALALVARAKILHNENIKVTDQTQKSANKAKIRKDLADAIDASNTAFLLMKNTSGSPEVSPQRIAETKMQTLRGAESAMQAMVGTEMVDGEKTDLAKTLTQEYVNAETDAAKKVKAQTVLGGVFRVAGDFSNALVEYKKALEMAPEDADALAGAGLSLFALGAGAVPENVAQEQEGLNYLQRFTEVAPENHPLKASVKESVDYLKSKSLTPQKTPKSATRKKP
jgi:tetratricopeptide (TPR) repeat protein